MIACPNCRHNNLNGTIFCLDCGAQLASTGRLIKAGTTVEESAFAISRTGDLRRSIHHQSKSIQKIIAFSLITEDRVFPLEHKSEFTIGRISATQLILPDIDLSDLDAYAQGVSRLHAKIKLSNNQATVIDLGSSNGTQVNGLRISPHVEYPLDNNDILALGKLQFKIQISCLDED